MTAFVDVKDKSTADNLSSVNDGGISDTSEKSEPGTALIKPQYLDLNHKPKLVVDYLPQSVAKELQSLTNVECPPTEADTEQDGPPKKKTKLKGRNKQRPINRRYDTANRLCSSIIRDIACSYGEKCRYSHDVQSYLATKAPDLGNSCHNFETFGKCVYGVTCRFSKQHVSDSGNNVINEALYNSMRLKNSTTNTLNKDTQILLRKKAYDFSKANEAVKKVSQIKFNIDSGVSTSVAPTTKTTHPIEGVVSNTDSVLAVDMAKNSMSQSVAAQTLSDNEVVMQTSDAVVEAAASAFTVDAELSFKAGPVTDEDIIRLKPGEKKMVNFKDKLYLAPLTTVGNLPFRRVCKNLGAEVTCGEMSLVMNLLQGQQSEWALIKRHESEKVFGAQICGGFPDTMTRCAQLLQEQADVDFIDINCGCPIDMIFKKGEGSALMGRANKFESIVRSMLSVLDIPLTVKMRTGIYEDKHTAHNLLPRLRDAGVSLVTLHGRSREQRYTKLADWDYITKCASAASPMPLFGNGDILSFEEANLRREQTGVSGIMIARGALIKPWIFTEIHEQRHWDISANERLDILKDFANYGFEHWGSDTQGVETTRKFLMEWLSFLYRYIPVGLLERVPQKINEKPPYYFGRNDLETLMASANCADWIKISEMLLGPVPDGYTFLPKHKANSYK